MIDPGPAEQTMGPFKGRRNAQGRYVALGASAPPTDPGTAVEITAITGGTSHGSMITLSGSGFGGTGLEVPALWDDGSVYDAPVDGTAPPPSGEGLPWEGSGGNQGDMALSVDNPEFPHRHPYQSVHYRKATLDDGGASIRPRRPWPEAVAPANQYFQSWWIRTGIDVGPEQGSNKFTRIRSGSTGELNNLVSSWTSHQHTMSNNASGAESVGDTFRQTNISANTWTRMELWYDGVRNRAVLAVNGIPVHDWDETTLGGEGDSPLLGDHPDGIYPQIIGWDPSTTDPDVGRMMVEVCDLYISSSRARVVASNHSTWDDAQFSHEIQPVEMWSDESVEAQCFIGALDESQDIYAYVINEAGAVNETGYLFKAA